MELAKITNSADLPTLEKAMSLYQRSILEMALRVCEGRRGEAAAALGIHRNTLARLCAEHGIPQSRHGRPRGRA